MRILMIGFGNVGRKVMEILSVARHRFPGLTRLHPVWVGVFTRSRGALARSAGLDPQDVLQSLPAESGVPDSHPYRTTLTVAEAVQQLDYDILVELSVLSIEQRGEPVVTWVREALGRGRHVVTANKGPAAFAHAELSATANRAGVRFLFESAVMDGAPVFNMARHALMGSRILEISGILNSTTNYVLRRLEEGSSLAEAVAEAQAAGFAEADPSLDLEGWDAAAKIAVLANVLLEGRVTPPEVARTGITGITPADIRRARDRGCRLKLVCRARRTETGVTARVAPEEIPLDDPFARVEGSGSILRLETDLMGPLLITQENPTLYDTAYGVLNDLLSLAAPV
ncbi:MAG: homoserine dehydrogenase [Acidobacteria bacterium]|nr:homoserine dehydrogenase [Acidobacteriota bacterium]